MRRTCPKSVCLPSFTEKPNHTKAPRRTSQTSRRRSLNTAESITSALPAGKSAELELLAEDPLPGGPQVHVLLVGPLVGAAAGVGEIVEAVGAGEAERELLGLDAETFSHDDAHRAYYRIRPRRMSDQLVRSLIADGAVRVVAAVTTDVARAAARRHGPGP